MKTTIYGPMLGALLLLGVCGCSGSTAKATPAEEKAFAGGPPPANYMDGANKTTATAQAQAQNAAGASNSSDGNSVNSANSTTVPGR